MQASQAGNSVSKDLEASVCVLEKVTLGWKVQSDEGVSRQITQQRRKLSHIFYPDVKQPARAQEESFPKLIFIIQKWSVSAPQRT